MPGPENTVSIETWGWSLRNSFNNKVSSSLTGASDMCPPSELKTAVDCDVLTKHAAPKPVPGPITPMFALSSA